MSLLQNQTILITGSSRGIGKAIAELFASEGARLVLAGRNLESLKNLQESLSPVSTQKETNSHIVLEMDVSSSESVKEAFQELARQKILIDCLVNNAGIMLEAPLMMTKTQQIEDIFRTNTLGAIFCTQLAIKSMIRLRKGSVIFLGSIIGTNGAAGQSVYSASKSALVGLTQSLSKELAPFNIRVNALAPGFIETNMTAGKPDIYYQKNLNNIGFRRFGTPEEVARVALFLASNLSGYVTGEVIGVNGGMII
ncbi:MAG: SDR family NAD(P)-dependent oxidoreductase [Saprospiraceae bacterium]|nr:SDR family NAD(P)-dependent oxidoreductase [Saprospiraceae bacterium]